MVFFPILSHILLYLDRLHEFAYKTRKPKIAKLQPPIIRVSLQFQNEMKSIENRSIRSSFESSRIFRSKILCPSAICSSLLMSSAEAIFGERKYSRATCKSQFVFAEIKLRFLGVSAFEWSPKISNL